MKDMIALRDQLTVELHGWFSVQSALMNKHDLGLSVELHDVQHHIHHVSKRLEIVDLAIRFVEKGGAK